MAYVSEPPIACSLTACEQVERAAEAREPDRQCAGAPLYALLMGRRIRASVRRFVALEKRLAESAAAAR